jgi:WD40 repeat protein
MRAGQMKTVVRIYDSATWTGRDAVADPDEKVHCLAFTNDGELTAVGTPEGTVRIWQNRNGQAYLAGDLLAQPKGLADLIFTADGKQLITGGLDGEVRIWDLEKTRPGGVQAAQKTLTAHKGRLVAFAVSPSGHSFATASNDDEVKLWETATGKELRRWDIRCPVRNLTFTPDGKHLVTANADSTAYLLELP